LFSKKFNSSSFFFNCFQKKVFLGFSKKKIFLILLPAFVFQKNLILLLLSSIVFKKKYFLGFQKKYFLGFQNKKKYF